MKKVAVTGPESTGKSWLCRELAAHFQGIFVPEFAREYLDRLNRDYLAADIVKIARGQLAAEQIPEGSTAPFMFCDTELIVTKIWSIHRYGKCDPYILKNITVNKYELFLLCDVDLPWEYDRQREHPHLRHYFMEWYKRELEGYGFPYRIVSGNGPDRLKAAIRHITDFFGL